ncbi:DNA gyrase subunit A [Acetobacteroides hydrogenigenes]|uniref:DNA gyrase subunit A n=1 Tax=Acetobacteroides hydrogenigenes TaxID=979970 RepID=A0A4R2E9L2_9BACT|nr:DNA gyrase subunit A [Acetobacteroides hydrogenigenes]TCN64495.1 DNA gyrase subunit A [Acetobacteroides hydrogenigenes]
MSQGEKIIKINIEEEMKTAYIDYSMSVIVARALPDVRDGLKPVHRRVLFGMNELGVYSNRPYKKSARIVGEVLGKFHPHGDTSVYDAMVRMAQEWSMRYPLVEGQGNFGSVDGDSPAAMRYTEARLKKLAEEALADLEKNTVDFKPNFDDTLEEPVVLPSKIPMLLLNGSSGIAVGMATNMAPHNLSEIVDATCAYIDNNDITIEELMVYIKAPDFPTGGIIYGYQGVRDAFETGKGKVVIRSKTEIEVTESGREKIIVSEIPYMVNKAEMIKKIADLINDKKIEGISYINDESDRNGMRVVIILKKDAVANVVLNNLYKHSQLQSSFPINNIALVDGRPRTLNLKQLIKYFVRHRHEVIIRRTQFELEQAEKRAHILEGLLKALDHLDEVISIIRNSKTPDEAQNTLIERLDLTEIQARAIIDMRLRSLTGLEREKLQSEYDELLKLINHLRAILADPALQMQVIKDELLEIKEKYGDGRRTTIVHNAEEFNPEDFYADEDVVITISHLGYIKRTPLSEYRTQSRGGVGSKGSTTRDEDFIEHIYVTSMHNTMLFFTENGRCYWLKVYDIPEGTKASKGRAIQNVLNIEPNDKVKAYMNVKRLTEKEYIENNFIVLCTKKGIIKKTKLEAYSRPRTNGVNAITIKDGDQLLEALLTSGSNEILIASKEGKALRFNEDKIRAIGRTGAGVKAITMSDTDEVVGMVCVDNQELENILVVSENGYGKRSLLDEYRITNRGGKGVRTMNITEKTGMLIAIKNVTDQNDLMIINKSGLTIRLAISDIRITGRATQGVKLINLRSNDSIASVASVPKSEDKDEELLKSTDVAENTEISEELE